VCATKYVYKHKKKIRRPLHKLSGKERILGNMGDCPAFIVQATNNITMIAMKQWQANVGLTRNMKYGCLTLRQGWKLVAHPNLTFVTVFIFLVPK